MKLLFFNSFRLGVLKGDSVVDVMSVVERIANGHPQDLLCGLIEQWSEFEDVLKQVTERAEGVPLNSVRVRPPVPRPTNIDCMAVNYMENGTLSEPPVINAFLKSPSSLIGDGETMVLPDVPASIFEGEAELALVIGKAGANIRAEDAMSHVFGYTNFIDGSARGMIPTDQSIYQMKSRATFGPMGPLIVTADEVPDPQNLGVKLWTNGILMQDFNTSDMAHKIPRCIEFVSSVHPIEPGDVLATGTNHGGLNPFMDGDQVELEVEGLGRLHIGIRDELKRTWERQTRTARREAHLDGATAPQLSGKYARS